MKFLARATVFCLVSAVFSVASAAEEPAFADTLTGDWGGLRSTLANKGVDVEAAYTGTLWNVADGGKKRMTTYLDLLEVRANLDGEKLLGIKGNSWSFSVINNNGAASNTGTVGSLQGIDNAEVGVNGTRLFEAWVNQEFLGGKLAVLLGLHDLNSEFAVTSISDNFLRPSMQIGQSFAQSGRNGPSIYPATSLGARVQVKPTETSYVAVAAYDGLPGDPDRTSSSAVKLGDKDGLLWVGEAGYTPGGDEWNKLALGGWHYTAGLDNVADSTVKDTAEGWYALASYRFYHDPTRERSVGAFLRGGAADGDTAQVDWDYEAGIVAAGWVRPESEIGLGVSQAHNGDAYMTSVSGAADRSEIGYELYYRDHVAPGVMLQPDIQYVVNPGMDQVTDDAFVVGMRLDIAF